MVKVIINADDLGKDHLVNEAIGNALIKGHITSSTIMATSETWDEVHKIVNFNPQASFGIHLNLTEGKALTNSEVLKEEGIVDANNFFVRSNKAKAFYEKKVLSAIYDEWDAQINKVINIEKINVTHIDSHHHVHMHGCYYEILALLAKKYNIHYIRRQHNTIAENSLLTKIKRTTYSIIIGNTILEKAIIKMLPSMKNRLYNSKWVPYLSNVVKFTDYFNGYEQWLSILQNGRSMEDNICIELMCHPGHHSYVSEYELIQKHTLESFNPSVKLCSYNDL